MAGGKYHDRRQYVQKDVTGVVGSNRCRRRQYEQTRGMGVAGGGRHGRGVMGTIFGNRCPGCDGHVRMHLPRQGAMGMVSGFGGNELGGMG